MKKRFVIGIDPGVKTGYACFDRESQQISTMRTTSFWNVMLWFEGDFKERTIAVIEVPNSRRAMYARIDSNSDAGRVRESMAARIGSNRREAELLAEGIERLGYEVRRVTPSRTKWTAADLKKYTGITERTSQHVRDAIALCYGL